MKRSVKSRMLIHLLLQPIYWTGYLFHRLCGDRAERRKGLWEKRLNYRFFLQGLPMLLGLSLIGVTALFAWRESHRLEATYSHAAQDAFEAGDFTRAALFYGRLVHLSPEREHYRYNLGIASAEQGDEVRAAALLEPLAPPDRLGYAPAHLWVAAHLLRTKPRPSNEQLIAAEAHFLRLSRESKDLAEPAEDGLTEIYAVQGRIDAILQNPRLLAAAERRPYLRLLLAQAAARQGRRAEAEEAARELLPELRRRVDDFPDDDQARLRLCEAYAILGNEPALAAVLREGTTIRPDGPFGEQLAELAVLRALRVGASTTATAAEKQKARHEAIQLLDRHGAQSPRLQLMAGQLVRQIGNVDEAERRYLRLVPQLPQVHLELADLYLKNNRLDDAKQEWEKFLASCQRTLAETGRLAESDRLLAAAAARQLGRFDEAERWLVETEPSSEIKAALMQLYAAWWDSVADEQRGVAQVDLLRKGLRVDPGNTLLLARMLTASRTDGLLGEAARHALQEMIAVGELPAAAYSLLGTDAYERGERETAERYLKQALRLDPQSAVTLNNLAWTLLNGEKPDLAAALAAAEAALSLAPNDPHFRDTRFRILARQEQWERALEDLEFCTATMKGDREFHRTAAAVYDKLKLPAPAAEHLRLAGER